MASTYTPNKSIEQPSNASYNDDWNVPVNADWSIIDTAFGGTTSISVTSVASGTYTLTLTQYQPPNIEFTGTLTGNLVYQLPTGVGGIWTISNATTGSFTLGFSVSGGNTYTLPQGQRSMLVSDGSNISTTQTYTAPTSQSIGILIWGQTTQESNAGVTPTYYFFPPGDWLRYGADPTGTNDSTAAINAANSCNSNSFDWLGGTYKCSAALTLYSNLKMYGTGSGTVLQFASGAVDNIFGYNISSAIVRDMKIVVTGTNGNQETGGVHIRDCNYVTVQNVEMVGMNWSGVFIDTCSYCIVKDCYFHGFTDTMGTGGDIFIYGISGSGSGTIGSNFNIFVNNECFGGGGYGIAIEDPYQAVLNGLPSFNIIANNRIGAHLTYGVLVYLPSSISTPQDTFNQVIGNFIENITGVRPSDPSYGMGIYVVGIGNGGTQVIGNTVINCCSGTTSRTLPIAAIAISGLQSGVTPVVVSNNTIAKMTQGDGIQVTGSPGGAVISANVINMPSNNNGSGPGGASLQGSGINIVGSFSNSTSYPALDTTLTSNNIKMYGGGSAVLINADSANVTRLLMTNNNCTANGAGNALQTIQSGGVNINYLTATGNEFNSTGGSSDAVSVNAVIFGNFSNNSINCTTQRAMYVNGCTNMSINGGSMTGGSVIFQTAGTCTNGFMDKTVNWNYSAGSGSVIVNAGTGFNIELRATAHPTAGTWAIGDHTQNTAPTSSGTPGWYCTTAGTPGTWSPEANL